MNEITTTSWLQIYVHIEKESSRERVDHQLVHNFVCLFVIKYNRLFFLWVNEKKKQKTKISHLLLIYKLWYFDLICVLKKITFCFLTFCYQFEFFSNRVLRYYRMKHDCVHTKTVVIGAGVSGISTAVSLLKNGYTDFLIFEALDRIGGRCHTIDYGTFGFMAWTYVLWMNWF